MIYFKLQTFKVDRFQRLLGRACVLVVPVSTKTACTWKEVVQPEQRKTALDSGCPACRKGEIYLGEPVDRK